MTEQQFQNPVSEKLNVANTRTILSVCSSYPRFDSDSASIFLRHLNRSIDKSSYRIIVLAPDHETVTHDIRDPGIEIIYFRYFFRKLQRLTYDSGVLSNIKRNPFVLLLVPFYVSALCIKLTTLILKRKPFLIHAHWLVPQGFIAASLGKLLSVPVVVTAHGGDAFALTSRWFHLIKHSTTRICTRWTANTDTTASAIDPNKVFRDKLTVIPLGVDLAVFTHKKELRTNPKHEKFTVLFVGRLVEKKGVSVLIRAYDLLPEKERAACQIRIIGSGAESDRLQEKISVLGHHDSITLLGSLSNPELATCYKQADILVVPSIVDASGDTEGQGVVIIEAMASGLPVLASNVGGIPDVIEAKKNGLLFTPGDAQDLSQKILYAMKNQDTLHELAENALSDVRTKYDLKIVAGQFEDLFSDIVREKERK